VYSSTKFGGHGFLIAGDAGATIDPLSSFGVKKAIVSGWVAAVVANTCLRYPEREDAAIAFFDRREREVFENYARLTDVWYGVTPDASVVEKLRAAPELHLRQEKAVEARAAIEGNLIVLREDIAGVNLRRLVEVAVRLRQVPDMFDAYNRAGAPVALPEFLTALASLLSEGVLAGL
jgi:flavin-dependent dehydrogenase